jgi:hypothetical protein
MNNIPKMLMMRPSVTTRMVALKGGTLISVMECPEYAVTVALYTRNNGEWEQIWMCEDAPGWFRDWAGLRARIRLVHAQVLSGH